MESDFRLLILQMYTVDLTLTMTKTYLSFKCVSNNLDRHRFRVL